MSVSEAAAGGGPHGGGVTPEQALRAPQHAVPSAAGGHSDDAEQTPAPQESIPSAGRLGRGLDLSGLFRFQCVRARRCTFAR